MLYKEYQSMTSDNVILTKTNFTSTAFLNHKSTIHVYTSFKKQNNKTEQHSMSKLL